MSQVINLQEAQAQFSQLLELAHEGEEIILAKGGEPYARLVPLDNASHGRKPGRLKGRLDEAFFDPLPENEVAAWEGP